MPVRCLVRPGSYFDSVVLMRIAAELGARPGVRAASLVMATAPNKDVLAAAGLLAGDARDAGANDLVVAIDAADDTADEALAGAEELLHAQTAPPAAAGGGEPRRPRTLAEVEGADLAIVSTPGRYAAAEALKALRLGLNAFVFSDNVPIEQEVELKREAHARGLIVMGPDCGTAIVSGIPLGFANDVRAGDIGLVGASGTGLQQVSCLIDRWGAGVSQMLGVGSHDLSAKVGAISMLDALDALAADPQTLVLGLVSKPPDPEVAERVLARAAASGKPVVAAFLGADPDGAPDGVTMAGTLEEAARLLVRASTGEDTPSGDPAPGRDAPAPHGDRRLLRGLYAGGTFAYEAGLLLEPTLGAIGENADPPTADRPARLPDAHLILDLGDDRFTVGRPHPMIDPAVRLDMLRAAGDDPRTAVIVLDVVLGHLAAPDPAGDLAPVIAEITARDDAPAVVCFVVGTEADPQDLARQERALRDSGAVLAASSSAAAALAQTLIATEVTA